MRKSTIRAFCLAVITASSMVPANAAPAVEYGANQYKSVPKTDRHTKSQAAWESKGDTKQLHLQCLKASLPNSASWQDRIARAAMVVDFTKASPQGVQVSQMEFRLNLLPAGVISTNTTAPKLRVEYSNGSGTHMKTIPILSRGHDLNHYAKVYYDFPDLKRLDLDPSEVRILRFAIVALPKENQYIDDYANMLIKNFEYWSIGSTKWNNPDVDLKIQDCSSDQLVNGN